MFYYKLLGLLMCQLVLFLEPKKIYLFFLQNLVFFLFFICE